MSLEKLHDIVHVDVGGRPIESIEPFGNMTDTDYAG